MDKNILKQIFFDQNNHWDKFVWKYGKRIRPVVIKEIDKFRGCGDPKRGFKLLVCEGCHDIRRIPYRCKSRFCTTCSTGEAEEWSRLMTEEVIQVTHRHVVFTIDEGLRVIFQKHRTLLKEFMNEAVRIIQEWFESKYKVTPGIIAGLHTFGARINFNPHVHMLVSMGGMQKDGKWKSYDFFPFEMLRKQWQTVVLKLIRRALPEEEKRKVQPLLQKAYSANGAGFYVYAPRQKGNIRIQLRYIGRYMRRPAIAMQRIVAYDGQFVTFSYKDKTECQEELETVTVEEFIARLISHIPDEQFKVIRHYGIYSRRIKALCKEKISSWQEVARKWIVKVRQVLRRRTWQQRRREETGKDPMVCEYCKCYYEYKGEVCLQEGQLTVKYADGPIARLCLERMICDITGIKTTSSAEEKEKSEKGNSERRWNSQLHLFAV